MSALFGIFDIIVIFILVFFNIWFWKKKWGCLLQLFGTLLYVFILPAVSIMVEIQIVTRNHENIESINLLYTYFRFPVYWFLFLCQIIFRLTKRKQPEKEIQPDNVVEKEINPRRKCNTTMTRNWEPYRRRKLSMECCDAAHHTGLTYLLRNLLGKN